MDTKDKFSVNDALDINVPCEGSNETVENAQGASNEDYDALVNSQVPDSAAASAVDRNNSRELEEEDDKSIECVQRIGKDQLTVGLLLMIEEYRDHIGAHHETFVTWVKRLSGRIPDSEALRHLLDTFATSKIARASVMFKKVPENIWLDARADSESDDEIEPQAEEKGDKELSKGGLVNEKDAIIEEGSLVLNMFRKGDVKFCSLDVEQPYSWTNYLDGINIDDLVQRKPHPSVDFDNFSNGLLYALWRTCVTLNFSNDELNSWLMQLSPVPLKKAVLNQLLHAAEAMHRHILAAPQHLGQLGVPILYYGKPKGKARSDATVDKFTVVCQQKNSYREMSSTAGVASTDSSIVAGHDQDQQNSVNEVETCSLKESDTPLLDSEVAAVPADDDIIVEKVVRNDQAGGSRCFKLLPLANVGQGPQCFRPSHTSNSATKISSTPSGESTKTSPQNCDITCVNAAASSTHLIGNNIYSISANNEFLSRAQIDKFAVQCLNKEVPKVPDAGNSSALTLGAAAYDGKCKTSGSVKCRQSVGTNHSSPVTVNRARTINTCLVGTRPVSPNTHVQHREQPNTSTSVDALALSERYQRPMPASKKRTLRSTSMQPQRIVFCGQDDGQSASSVSADGVTEGAAVSPEPLSMLRPTAQPAHLFTSACNNFVRSSLVVPDDAQVERKIFQSFVSIKKMKLDSNKSVCFTSNDEHHDDGKAVDVAKVSNVDVPVKKNSANALGAAARFSPPFRTSPTVNNSSTVMNDKIPEKVIALSKSHLRPAVMDKLLETSSHSISSPIQIDLRSDDDDEASYGTVNNVTRDRAKKHVVPSGITGSPPRPPTSDLLTKSSFFDASNKRSSDLPYFQKPTSKPCALHDSLGKTGKNHGVDLNEIIILNSGYGTRLPSPNKCNASKITTEHGNHCTASRVIPSGCIRLSKGLSSALAPSVNTNPDLKIPVISEAPTIASSATSLAEVISQVPRSVTTVSTTQRPITTPRITTRKDLMPTSDPSPVLHPTSNLDSNISSNETMMRPCYRQVNKVPPLNPLMSNIFPNGTIALDAVSSPHAFGPTPILPRPAAPLSMLQRQQLQQGRAVLISGNGVASSSLNHLGSQGPRVTGAAIVASAPHLPLVTITSANGLQPIAASNNLPIKETFSTASAENNDAVTLSAINTSVAAEAYMQPQQLSSKVSSSFCVNGMEQHTLQSDGAISNVGNLPTIIHNGKPYRAYLLTPSAVGEDSTVDLLGSQQKHTSPELSINPALRQAFLEAKNSSPIILNPCDKSLGNLTQQNHSSSSQNVFSRQFPSQNTMPMNNDMINSNSHLQLSMQQHQQPYLGGSFPYTVQLPGGPNQQTPSNFLNYASMFHQQQGQMQNMSQQQHLHNPQLPTASPMSTYLTMLPNPGGKAVHIMQSQNNIQNHMIIHGTDSSPAPSTSGGVPLAEPMPGLNDKVSALERQLQAIQAQNELLMQINKKLLSKKAVKKHKSPEKKEEASSCEEESSEWSESSSESDVSGPSSAKRKGGRTTRSTKRKVKKHDVKGGLDDKGSFKRMRGTESKQSPRRTQRSSKR